jgi:CheY-like chemotaxis protein
MSRILLADDSPHAQRMGERILREEGFEVVTVTDGDTAMMRLGDVNPDLVVADVYLPGKSGYEICRAVKTDPRFRFTRVVLTAGALEPIDEEEARRVLIEAAEFARGLFGENPAPSLTAAPCEPAQAAPPPALSQPALELDAERVRAAVTLALEAALPAMIDEITDRVLIALGH